MHRMDGSLTFDGWERAVLLTRALEGGSEALTYFSEMAGELLVARKRY